MEKRVGGYKNTNKGSMAYTYENAIKKPITLPDNLKNKLGVCGVRAVKGIMVPSRDKVETPVTLRDR